MDWIDTHAHIYDERYGEDIRAVIARFGSSGGRFILMPNIDTTTYPLMMRTHRQNKDITKAMLGLHPAYVSEDYEVQLADLEMYLMQEDFVAVGETGLDNILSTDFKKQQEKAFRRQIEWARLQQLPIVIHARNSLEACIDIVSEYSDIRGVFHCFTGTAQQARRIIDLGFYLGIGGVITYKSGQNILMDLADIPLAYMIMETDAPYMSPVPYRGKTNEPAYLIHSAEKLAAVKRISLEEVALQTTQNACRLFNI